MRNRYPKVLKIPGIKVEMGGYEDSTMEHQIRIEGYCDAELVSPRVLLER